MKKKKKRNRKSSPRIGKKRQMRLSLCMIVKDESENIEACLRSIAPVLDEIIVVDTGSTDNTKEIAEKMGAKVFDFPWRDDFAAARNESIRHATGDYIIWLDADDRIDRAEVNKMKSMKSILPKEKNKAFYVVLSSQSPVDGESLLDQLRIFPNIQGAVFVGRVHEQIYHNLQKMGVELVRTDIVVRHTGYHDAAAILEKSERNLGIILDELKREPDDLLLRFNAARTLIGIGRGQNALEHMEKIMGHPEVREKHPRFFLEAGMLMGKYYLDMGQADEAESVFRELSQGFGEEGLVHFYLGESLLRKGKYREAIDELHNALRFPVEVGICPVNPDAIHFQQYYSLGMAYQHTGELERAGAMFLKSLDFPGHYKSLQELGVLSLKDCNYEEAAGYFERAIHEGKDSDTNYSNLGLAYHKMGEIQKAQEAFLKSLDINPDHVETLTNLGHLYLGIKDYDKALDCFVKTRGPAPALTDAKLALSIIYFHFKEIELMVGECDALLQELGLPRNITVSGFEDLALLYEKIGDRLTDQGRLQLALMAYKISLRTFPFPEILEKMAPLASRSGDVESFIEEVREILAEHSGRGEMMETIVKVLGEARKNC